MEGISRLWPLFLLFPATIRAGGICSDFTPDYFQVEFLNYEYYNFGNYQDDPYFDSRYTELYCKFEEALLYNKTLLEDFRAGFISKGDIPIYFWVKLELMNGTDAKCSEYHDYDATFCPNTSYPGSPWTFCNPPNKYSKTLDLIFSPQTLSSLQAEEQKQIVDNSILWLSFLHGNLLPLLILWPGGTGYDWYRSDVLLTLRIGKLDCNPSFQLTECVLSELLSWVCYNI